MLRKLGMAMMRPLSPTRKHPAQEWPLGSSRYTLEGIGVSASLRKERSPMTTTLVRPRNDRMIAGVCAGVARQLGIKPNVVRLLFVLSLLLPGPQILLYILGWVLMPDESRTGF
jgi:phage shock protein PspC (stress-responsive transcriptional regulator)